MVILRSRSKICGTPDAKVPEPFKIAVFADPLCDVRARLAEKSEIGVELVGDDALVFPVVIADDILPTSHLNGVNDPAIFEIQSHSEQQRRQVVIRSMDGQSLPSAE